MRALRHGEDALLLSDTAPVAQGNPAGLLFGLIAVGDGSPASLTTDFESRWTAVSEGDPDFPYFVVSPRAAMHLATLNEDGTPLFPNISPAIGGNIYGVRVLLSKAAGAKVVLIDGGRIAVTYEGLEIDRSRQAAVQMVDNPTAGAASLVSALADVELTCVDCNSPFIFTIGEQRYFGERGLHLPRRCKSRRIARRDALDRQRED